MLTTGPNLGQLDNGAYGDQNYSEFLRLLRALDLLVQCHVISMSVGTPPAAPQEGNAYIIPTGATGVWETKAGQIARWTARSAALTPKWEYFEPKQGWSCSVDDLDTTVKFVDGNWVGSGTVISNTPPADDDGMPNGTIYLQVQ